jgi:DNA-binding MarR family transcriptional regulator
MSEITLTARDMAVLRKLGAQPNLETSLTSSGWQPQERDLEAVDSMIGRGIVEKRPGFANVQLTEAGADAYEDALNEGRRDA